MKSGANGFWVATPRKRNLPQLLIQDTPSTVANAEVLRDKNVVMVVSSKK